jgi:UbiD family decarboxylase
LTGITLSSLLDLRKYIAALHSAHEVQEIAQEVELDLEVGAIIRRCYETGSPAPFFQRIRGVNPGFRILGAPAGVSRQPNRKLARIALSLDMDLESTGREIVEKLASAHEKTPIPPTIVPSAACFENTFLGDDIDITRLPAPLLHGGDGGRYLNTFGCIVARTPDGSWTNWSIARIMVVDGKRMTGLIAPEQHIGVVRQAWKDIGKPMPFALALGVEPAIPFVCGMPLPAHVDENGYLGAILGRSIQTVKCRTVDLEAPASAEILIEGHVALDETTVEGPMGEYPGYIWLGEGSKSPVYHVTALSYRNDPILPVVVAGEPVEENHTTWGIPCAAQCLSQLRDAKLPVTTTWIPLEAALHWLVVTVPSDWRSRSNGQTAEEFCRHIGDAVFHSKAGVSIPKIIVLHDDVDPTNLSELVWAFATRCHPSLGSLFFNKEDTSPLVAFLRSSEKTGGTTAKVVYNCLQPDEWGDKLPARSSFRHCYPTEIVDRVLANWKHYGFSDEAGS